MGRDPKIIAVDKTEGDVIYVSYRRPDDGTVWKQRCRIEGTKIIWATETGRWRVHPLDEVITYSATPSALTIQQKFTDGSTSTKSYSMSQLKSK